MSEQRRSPIPEDDHRTVLDFMPPRPRGEEVTATAGARLPAGEAPASEASVVAALREIYDPELPVNIYDLGLIYRLAIDAAGAAEIEMTLTAPACPVAGIIPQQVADKVAAVPGVGEVEVRLVWDPPWTKERMSEDARLALDIC